MRGRATLSILLLTACRTQDPAPDVLLVVLDTVRADRLSTYGHERPTSQQLTEIGNAGVVFTDVTAPAPWTWPSHASLFTGLDPWEHGARWSTEPDHAVKVEGSATSWQLSPMRSDVPTLAERFGSAGYRTVSLSANCLLHADLGLVRGFQRAKCQRSDAWVVEEARQELAARTDDRPLFLFVNLLSAHAPYLMADGVSFSAAHASDLDPSGTTRSWMLPYLATSGDAGLYLQRRPEVGGLSGEESIARGDIVLTEADRALMRDLYDGDLVRLDHALKALVEAWNGSGRGDGVVAVTSDHGELLGEHDRVGHGADLWPELLQVPLVIAAPERWDPGVRIDTPISLTQLPATILDLAGLLPIEGAAPGLDAVRNGGSGPGFLRAAVWPLEHWAEKVHPRYAERADWVRKGDHVVRRRWTQPPVWMTTTGASAPPPEDAAELLAARPQPEHDSVGGTLELDVDTLKQLQTLGYVDPAAVYQPPSVPPEGGHRPVP